MKRKKPYLKPEIKTAELSFTTAQMAACHTPTNTTPLETFPPSNCGPPTPCPNP